MNEAIERIRFALSHATGKSVHVISREQWRKIVSPDGSPTLQMSSSGLGMEMKDACVVAVAASGIQNPDPGADIVRYDADDYPWIYNTDHYLAVENLSGRPDFSRILELAGLQQSQALLDALSQKVFLLGPEKLENHHWQKEIVPHICNGKWKEPQL